LLFCRQLAGSQWIDKVSATRMFDEEVTDGMVFVMFFVYLFI
jgi:hypothetical protein